MVIIHSVYKRNEWRKEGSSIRFAYTCRQLTLLTLIFIHLRLLAST